MKILQENDIAPDFKLESTENKEVSLSDFAGKNIVLYFYPKDATAGCTIEANDFNKYIDEFHQFDCLVLGISRDNITSHKKFITAQCLAFPLLSDPEGEVNLATEASIPCAIYSFISASIFLSHDSNIVRLCSIDPAV